MLLFSLHNCAKIRDFLTYKSAVHHLQRVNTEGYMDAQVLDLGRTPARVQHATSHDSPFLMHSEEGLVFDACLPLSVFPTALNPFLFQLTCQRGHTPKLTLFHKPSLPPLHTTKLNPPPAGNRWALNLGCASSVSSVGVVRGSLAME